jgi:transposase
MYTDLDDLSPCAIVKSHKFSKKEQELRQAAKQVQLQGKAIKVVSKTTGISAREINDFIDEKSKQARNSGEESSKVLKERFEARLSQAVAACHPVQPDGCQQMSVRDAQRMFGVPKSTISRRINDHMAGHRITGRYCCSCV